MNIAEMAETLIDIPSVTGEEAALAEFLAGRLAADGFTVERDELNLDQGDGRVNLFAWRGQQPRVVLCTHLDTVPPYFPSRREAETLHGRGACDAKGTIAAMLSAGAELAAAGLDGWGYLFVVGEETDSIGAQRANGKWGNRGCRAILVGEPTGNCFALAQKGSYRIRLECVGRAAHSAYPEMGESATEKLVDILHAIGRETWGSDELLGPATVNIGMLGGGLAANIVAGSAWAALQFRVVTRCAEVEDKLDRLIAGRGLVEVECRHDPSFMGSLPGYPTTVVAFGTDVPFLKGFGRPYLVGPGSILDAHSAHEKVEIADLEAAAALYAAAVKSLLRDIPL